MYRSNMSETVPLKKFLTETEIEETRKQRQEEWEKVRQPHQPLEAPEEPVETRSLFEQLQAQKEQKQLDYEEQHRLRNQIRGLEKEETDFLEGVMERQQEIEKTKYLEECEVLKELHTSVASRTLDAEPANKTEIKLSSGPSKKRTSQLELLAGAVKKRRADNSAAEEQATNHSGENVSSKNASELPGKSSANASASESSYCDSSNNAVARVAGVLPGIGVYTDSENSDSSSSDSDIDTDIFRHGDQVGHKSGHDSTTAAAHRHR